MPILASLECGFLLCAVAFIQPILFYILYLFFFASFALQQLEKINIFGRIMDVFMCMQIIINSLQRHRHQHFVGAHECVHTILLDAWCTWLFASHIICCNRDVSYRECATQTQTNYTVEAFLEWRQTIDGDDVAASNEWICSFLASMFASRSLLPASVWPDIYGPNGRRQANNTVINAHTVDN